MLPDTISGQGRRERSQRDPNQETNRIWGLGALPANFIGAIQSKKKNVDCLASF